MLSCFLPWAPTGFPILLNTEDTNLGGVGTVRDDFRILDIAVVCMLALAKRTWVESCMGG